MAQCQKEFDTLKKDLHQQIEKQQQERFEEQAKLNKELESMYEAKLKKQEEETALLKKTLLEQSLQRLVTIQEQSRDLNSEESNSLEGSHGLHHFSNNSSEMPSSSEKLQTSSSHNTSQQAVMQQELADFAKIFHGDLTQEEQDLVSQLTSKAAALKKDSLPNSDKNQMALEELQPLDDNEDQLDGMEDDDVDYEDDDYEQFGEEDSESPPDQRKLI